MRRERGRRSAGGKANGAVAVFVNAADRDSVVTAVDQSATELDGFDVIINNAGNAPQVSVEDAMEKDFDTIFDINVKGAMRRRGSARLAHPGGAASRRRP